MQEIYNVSTLTIEKNRRQLKRVGELCSTMFLNCCNGSGRLFDVWCQRQAVQGPNIASQLTTDLLLQSCLADYSTQ